MDNTSTSERDLASEEDVIKLALGIQSEEAIDV
jgi:hypothetical protein